MACAKKQSFEFKGVFSFVSSCKDGYKIEFIQKGTQ